MQLSIIREELRKPYAKIAILVFLASLFSFGTGYLVGRDWNPAPIIIEKNSK